MKNIELSESLVKELFQNGLPNIGYIPVNEQSPNIVRVVCDFGLMDCKKLHYILKEFSYQFDSKQFNDLKNFRNYILNAINSIVGV